MFFAKRNHVAKTWLPGSVPAANNVMGVRRASSAAHSAGKGLHRLDVPAVFSVAEAALLGFL